MLLKQLSILGDCPAPSEEGLAPFSGVKGDRLRHLFGLEDIGKLVNLMNVLGFCPSGGFPIRVAGLLASQIPVGDTTIFVGKRVASLFGLGEANFLEWWDSPDGGDFAVIPHLAKTNPWWQKRGNSRRASMFLCHAAGITPPTRLKKYG